MKICSVHIDNYKIFQDFNIDFTHNGKAQNLIVLAGINGSGKTTLMRDVLFDCLMTKKTSFNYKLHSEKGISYTSTPESDIDKVIIIYVEKNAISGTLTSKYLEAGSSPQQTSQELILNYVDKLIYEQDKKSSEAYAEVQRVLNVLFDGFELQVEFNGVDKDRKVWFKNQQSEQISIAQLSSGEQELINKCFSLYLDDIKDSVIFIDEPEGSMHPNWQSRIAPIYQKIADDNNCQIFLATHSPQIVASVKKEQVRVLVKDNGLVRVIHDFEGSYGWRIDRVLLDIFGASGLRTPVVEAQLKELRELVYNNQFETEGYAVKFAAHEQLLGYGDIDLSLLRLEVLKRKKQREKDQ